MHETLLKVLGGFPDGKASTSAIMTTMGIQADKRMYSAMDNFAKHGHVTKTKDTRVGKKGNIWILSTKGKDVLKELGDEILSVKEYDKNIQAYRRGNPQPSAKKKYKSAQKDLLHQPVNTVKKEPEIPMPSMSASATAAVEGIAKVIDDGQKSHSLIVQIHRLCDDYINNKK